MQCDATYFKNGIGGYVLQNIALVPRGGQETTMHCWQQAIKIPQDLRDAGVFSITRGVGQTMSGPNLYIHA